MMSVIRAMMMAKWILSFAAALLRLTAGGVLLPDVEVTLPPSKRLGMQLNAGLVVLGFVRDERGVAYPAELSGMIMPGDTLLSINGVEVTSIQQLSSLLSHSSDGWHLLLRPTASGLGRVMQSVGHLPRPEDLVALQLRLPGLSVSVDAALAQSVGLRPSVPLRVVRADPPLACTELQGEGHRGAMVLVRRGSCSFASKAAILRRAAAAAMVVVLSGDALERVSLEGAPSEAAALDVVSVTADAGRRLETVLNAGHGREEPALGRLGAATDGRGEEVYSQWLDELAAGVRQHSGVNNGALDAGSGGAGQTAPSANDGATLSADSPSAKVGPPAATELEAGTARLSMAVGGESGSVAELGEVEFVAAAFGPRLRVMATTMADDGGAKAKFVLSVAEPADACSDLAPLRLDPSVCSVAGAAAAASGLSPPPPTAAVAVLVERGGCAFEEKRERVERALAAAFGGERTGMEPHLMLVANSEPGLFRMQGSAGRRGGDDDYPGSVPQVASVLITSSAGKTLLNAAASSSSGNVEVQLLPESKGAVPAPRDIVDTWQELMPLLENHINWPRDERKRRKKYLALAKKNHPDKRGRGSQERFEFLRLAYEVSNSRYGLRNP